MPPLAEYVQARQALTELNKRFSTQATQNIAMIALCGISGSGKTELAKTYAYAYAKTLTSLKEPPIIWWLGAETPQTLQNNYLILAEKLGIIITQPEKLKTDQTLWKKFIQEVHSRATSRPGWLLIYDNVEKPDVLKDYLFHASGTSQGHILVTTQHANFFTSTEQNLSLDAGFTLEEAVNLLHKLSGLNDTNSAADLAKALGHLPLTLMTAALAIRNNFQRYEQLNFNDYLIQHKELHPTIEQYQQVIFHNLSLIFNKLPASAIALLQALAYLPSDNVPYCVLRSYLKNLSNENDNTVDQQLKSGLVSLKSYSLLNEQHANNIENIHFNIHRIVQTAMQLRLQKEKPLLGTVALTLLKTMNQLYPDLSENETAENFAHCRMSDAIVEHMLPLIHPLIEKNRAGQELYLFLIIKRAIAKRKWGDAKRALRFAEDAKHLAKALNMKTQETDALWEIRAAYCALGQEKKVSNCDEEILTSYKSIYGENHEKIAWCLCQMGNDYDNLGNFFKALEYKQEALARYKSIYDENHPDVIWCLTEFANSLDSSNQPEEALTEYQTAMALHQSLHGDKNSNVAWCLLEMGICYNGMGKFQDALNAIQEALSIYKTTSSSNQLNIAWGQVNMGNSYDGLKQFQQAHDAKSEALQIYKALYGENHPKVAWCLLSIADSFNASKQYAKSRNIKKQALAMYKSLYGDDHPAIAQCLENIGHNYYDLGEVKKAQRYYRKALMIYKKLYDTNHLSVAKCMVIIGNCYDHLNQPRKAIKIKHQALIIYKTLCGEDHPDVAWCLGQIGSSYGAINQPQIGLRFKQQALAIFQKIHTCDYHYDIACCFEMIGNSWDELKQPKKGLEFKHIALNLYIKYKVLTQSNNDRNIASCLNNIAWSYNTFQRYEESLNANQRALAIFKALHGDEHPDVAQCLDYLGHSYLFLNQPENALSAFHQALHLYKIFFGEKNNSVAYVWSNIGQCHQRLSHFSAAKKAYRKALSIFSELYPQGENPDIAQIQQDLDRVEIESKLSLCNVM